MVTVMVVVVVVLVVYVLVVVRVMLRTISPKPRTLCTTLRHSGQLSLCKMLCSPPAIKEYR
jgi:hypothetical protein